ncbi:SPOR domain-containing protein [Granulicella cerasi]|uniref:SPOR domain-containing protein n=2 Tax=Granulicella cerasi TaxID=741063 RepID=A0ABW1ZCT6_9BACT
MLVNALRGRGYSVYARTEPTDNLTRVQVGPFGSKHDADAMRQRLLADGYNAIVK